MRASCRAPPAHSTTGRLARAAPRIMATSARCTGMNVTVAPPHHPPNWPARAARSHRVLRLRLLDRAPYALGGRRHLNVLDAVVRERVDDRVHHRGQRAGAACFAAALDAERIELGRDGMALETDLRRVRRARHRVVHV